MEHNQNLMIYDSLNSPWKWKWDAKIIKASNTP